MVNDPHDKIIDKIDKLLRLSRSDNENEARAAMVKAQELIAKHNISREELGQEEERQVVTMTSSQDFARDYKRTLMNRNKTTINSRWPLWFLKKLIIL